MATYQRECLASVKGEMIPMLDLHWMETEPNQDTIKLDPDWKEYAKLDAAGILHIFTAREGGLLIGYCVVMISASMHHKGHIFADTDVIYINPKHRKGRLGSDLIHFADKYCEEAGASLMTINMKVDSPFDNILVEQGFELIERVYHKCALGE